MSASAYQHTSVLLQECITALNIVPNGIYVDATFGGGGHSAAILQQLGPKGKLIAFDQDAAVINHLPEDNRVTFINENFRYMKRFLRLLGIKEVNGILADLGVSSYQFDTAERGFSIRFDAELDMRMDARATLKASDIINRYSEAQMHKIFEQYGEVTNARTLASTIIQQRHGRQINTISDFKHAIQSCVRGNTHKYLAQVFQALRIEVNAELQVLEMFCTDALTMLAPQGSLCVISFHSLEERVVKHAMQGKQSSDDALQHNPFIALPSAHKKEFIVSKPITPSQEEIKNNARSRSAKLRVAIKK
jgi:16S rRNA (cytosine1402-N4)-methyltransferase